MYKSLSLITRLQCLRVLDVVGLKKFFHSVIFSFKSPKLMNLRTFVIQKLLHGGLMKYEKNISIFILISVTIKPFPNFPPGRKPNLYFKLDFIFLQPIAVFPQSYETPCWSHKKLQKLMSIVRFSLVKYCQNIWLINMICRMKPTRI